MPEIRCTNCGQPYPNQGAPYVCPACGGVYDYDAPPEFSLDSVDQSLPGYWRFQHTFSLMKDAPRVTLGEGNTPLIWEQRAGLEVGLKLESLNPTGSYKDRGSAVLVSQLLARGVRDAVEDSSGNAGASFAAYAARSGIRSRIFVPEAASGPKRAQIEMYGAELVRVPGPRSEAAKAVLEATQHGSVYASHAYLPFSLPGIATIAYEIWEQLGRRSPGCLIAPVGHGGLLLGIRRGFAALKNADLIDEEPYYLGVQAAACDPIVRASQRGLEAMKEAGESPTLAEGVRVRTPVRAKALLSEIPNGKGAFVAIQEEEIKAAYLSLGRRGIYVEPTSALVWAGLSHLQVPISGLIIAVLTGIGLKYMPS